jgi:hypothetical protein
MLLQDCSFRDLYEQIVFIRGGKLVDGLKEGFLEIQDYVTSADVDSCLSYCYIDSQAGISFHFLCFANYDNESIDMNSYNAQVSNKSMNLFRYEPVYEVKEYTGDASVFIDRIIMVNTGYHDNKNVLPTRDISDIDHLRHKNCPDDIKVLLRKDGLEAECPWVRLIEIRDGKLYGQLLNEPFEDYGVHSGDTIQIVLGTFENQVYAVVNIA